MTPAAHLALRPGLGECALACDTSDARVIDIVYPARMDFDTHVHDQAYLCLTVRGTYDEWVEGEREPRCIAQGRPLVYPTGSSHAVRTGEEPVQIVHVTDPLGQEWAGGISPLALGLLTQLSAAVSQRFDRGDAEQLHLECLVHELGVPREDSVSSNWVDSLLDRLRECFREPVLLTDLAREADRHPSHVARAFRARWRMTAGEVLRRFRVAAAVRQLAETTDSLSLVALDCGFADQSHMGRWLQTYIGRTPNQIRTDFRHSA